MSASHRYTVPVHPEDSEVVAARLWAAGAAGVWEQPGQLIAWFAARDVDDLPPGGSFTEEPDRDWQALWKATIAPVDAGRFRVIPTWLADQDGASTGEATLVLDPGRAFGSGHHATTVQCLELLDELVVGDRPAGELTGVSVADVGCGSGVLAIAAARRGARVVAVDVDPDAIEVTTENGARNDVTVATAVGSVGAARALAGGPAEVVLANLATDTIAELAADLVDSLQDGGVLIASGIAADRAEVALDALRAAGLVIEDQRVRDGWVALRGRRPTTSGGAPRRWPAAGTALLLALVLAGCSDPMVGAEDEVGDPSEAPIASSVPDPSRDALVVEVRRLGASVQRARDELAGALEAEGPQRARIAAQAALEHLVAPTTSDPEADERPLFPAESPTRDGDTDAPDQLTNTLTSARDAGGPLGAAVVDLLRDPVAGDLGAWQRDAAGVIGSVAATTREADDLEGLEAAISELPGLGTQALAWVQLAAGATDLDDARAYAERGLASLDVVLVSLDLLELGDTDGAADDGTEGDGDDGDGA